MQLKFSSVLAVDICISFELDWGLNPVSCLISVKIAQQDGVLLQEKVHLANQVKLQLPGDEASDQTIAMTVIEAMPYYDQML